MELPSFLIKRTPKRKNIRLLRQKIGHPNIHTVCEEASCPNIGECYSGGVCTFMILGDNCTRACAFCGIRHGDPSPPDPDEPALIAEAANKLGLNYIVVTSVMRDDLPDGGASQFVKTIGALRGSNLAARIEVLIPDFRGSLAALQKVVAASPFVINHNLETIKRLYGKIRPQAIYDRSLALIKRVKALKSDIYTKSGFMVGLGESDEEVVATLKDLAAAGCDIITIGQYLPPSPLHLRPERYVEPGLFEQWKNFGKELGIKVEAGPFVRSSYHAENLVKK